ncbi:MAG: sugar porter family MFS transporter [Chthoniobacterales bacterium]|nr:sugar porter family MFS transporter [Chthoniobacterales bacterium]
MKPSTPKYSTIVYFIGITAALAGLLFGLDIGVISGAEEFIQKEFQVTDHVIELIVSATLWGAVFGVFISGTFSNFFGRKKTMLLSGFIFVGGSLACAISHSAYWLIYSRFFLGIAVGLASFTAPLYLSEISPEKIRGTMVAMYQLMITIGILLAFFSDMYFGTTACIDGIIGGHWRLMLGVIAFPAILMFVGMLFLPESPRWLFLKGFQEEGISVFKKMLLPEEEVNREVSEIKSALEKKQAGFQMLFSSAPFRRAIFLGITLQLVQQLTGINVVMYYAPRIFKIAGFASTSGQLWGTVIVGLTNMLATFIAIAFVDKLGRKPMMYAGLTVMGTSMVAIGLFFNSNLEASPVLGYYAIIALLLFIIGFAMSAGPIIWIICSEIFPLKGRDLGITFSTSANWISNAIIGGTFLTMLSKLGNGNTFLLYGSLQVLFIIFFFFFVPETKGVSLEKIESNLFSGLPLRKIGK